MALSVEVAELVEHFQWLTQEQSRNLSSEKLAKVKEEIGDIMIYLVNLADKLGIDPLDAAHEKLAKNKKKYPADTVSSDFFTRPLGRLTRTPAASPQNIFVGPFFPYILF